jgi:6-phosphogluconolactonase (cycloisomerase 2 family)
MAQGTFVYTNNDIPKSIGPKSIGPNSVSALSADANGSLTPIPGSPFLTGGSGIGGGFFAANRITSVVVKHFLYAGNSGSDSLSAFAIDPSSGILTPVPGSPFATGGAAGGLGISLAATPDDNFLIAASGASNTITVYSIAANGALAQVAGSPFPVGPGGSPDGIKVTPDGRFLAVAQPIAEVVSMFDISPTGVLTSVPGSPFPASGQVAGVDCDCSSSHIFGGQAGQAGSNTRVSVFDIGPNGSLSEIAGSPFTGPGINSNIPVLSPDDKILFVSNQFSDTVTVFSVATGGALTPVPGSPFATPGAVVPSGMATNEAGTFLYVACREEATPVNSAVYGYSIAANGALTAVLGSPFSTGAGGFLNSLTVFPPKSCCPAPMISGVSATPDVLWPPNHKFMEVTINYTVADSCPNTCVLTIASNESVNGTGDGNTSPDWQVIDAQHVRLRAERAGSGTGRIYTITITCTNDSNKESSIQTVTVLVRHDQGK